MKSSLKLHPCSSYHQNILIVLYFRGVWYLLSKQLLPVRVPTPSMELSHQNNWWSPCSCIEHTSCKDILLVSGEEKTLTLLLPSFLLLFKYHWSTLLCPYINIFDTFFCDEDKMVGWWMRGQRVKKKLGMKEIFVLFKTTKMSILCNWKSPLEDHSTVS